MYKCTPNRLKQMEKAAVTDIQNGGIVFMCSRCCSRTETISHAVKELDLSSKKLGDNGVTKIANALKVNWH